MSSENGIIEHSCCFPAVQGKVDLVLIKNLYQVVRSFSTQWFAEVLSWGGVPLWVLPTSVNYCAGPVSD